LLDRRQLGDYCRWRCRQHAVGPPLAVLALRRLGRVAAARQAGITAETRQHALPLERVQVGLGEDRYQPQRYRRCLPEKGSDAIEVAGHRGREA